MSFNTSYNVIQYFLRAKMYIVPPFIDFDEKKYEIIC